MQRFTAGSFRYQTKFVISKRINGITRYGRVYYKQKLVYKHHQPRDKHYQWEDVCWVEEKEYNENKGLHRK